LLKTFEVSKTEYINNLYSVFESLQLDDNFEVARALWNTPWQLFAQGKMSLDLLTEGLNLNDKDHSDKIRTLIRCAHFQEIQSLVIQKSSGLPKSFKKVSMQNIKDTILLSLQLSKPSPNVQNSGTPANTRHPTLRLLARQ
ncbi:hypothetical protein VP01_13518g1, partial [Puccinia sorghi]